MENHALEAWTDTHDAAVVLHVAGRSDEDIASLLDRSVEWVKAVVTSDRAGEACVEFERDVIDQVASRAAEVQGRLRSYAGEALDALVELMRLSVDESMRFKASTAILDRAGFTAVQRSIVASTQLPKDVVDRMQETMRDMEVIDASYEILPRDSADA